MNKEVFCWRNLRSMLTRNHLMSFYTSLGVPWISSVVSPLQLLWCGCKWCRGSRVQLCHVVWGDSWRGISLHIAWMHFYPPKFILPPRVSCVHLSRWVCGMGMAEVGVWSELVLTGRAPGHENVVSSSPETGCVYLPVERMVWWQSETGSSSNLLCTGTLHFTLHLWTIDDFFLLETAMGKNVGAQENKDSEYVCAVYRYMEIFLGYFVVGLELMLLVSGVHLLWARREGQGVTGGGRKPRRQENLQILMHFLVWVYAMGGWGFEEGSAAIQLIHWYRRLGKNGAATFHISVTGRILVFFFFFFYFYF